MFGSARYRGRVERILASSMRASTASHSPRNPDAPCEAIAGFHPRSAVELFRELIVRSECALLEPGSTPSLADIERLLKVKRQVDALEALERMNAIVLAAESPR